MATSPTDKSADQRRSAAPTERRGTPPGHYRRTAEQDLIYEIATAAERLAAARDPHGDPIFRTDGVWRVLTSVARSPYCLAIAGLARALKIRRQTAHELAHSAARAGIIELAPNPQDKRILQALLTAKGRAAFAAAHAAEAIWLATLLNGLGDHHLAATTQVVSVIRQRLERDARELARRTPKP